MNINSTNFTAFQAVQPKVTRFYVPGKDNTTLRCMMTEVKDKVTGINYDLLKGHGKVVETKQFANKKGFSDYRIVEICDKIQTRVREGYEFLDELIRAQRQGGN